MIHIGVPLENINMWNTTEEIESEMRSIVETLSFPENAHVKAWFSFMPSPTEETKMILVQEGFYKDPYIQ